MKFSHKAELKLSSTNLDLKEGEGCLAKHGCGGDEGFSWGIHGGCEVAERYGEGEERKLREKWSRERKGIM